MKLHSDSLVRRLNPAMFEAGRVFTVGDIHGCLSLLQRAMEQVKFDPSVDTLICVGDLIDRGPQSAQSVLFLQNDFVYAVRGNHEDMLIRAQEDERWAENFIRNGGMWWMSTPQSLQQDILQLVKKLPIAIELPTPRGLVGFVHADVPHQMTWQQFTEAIEAGDEHIIQTALWGRNRIQSGDDAGVMGVGRVFVGHTPSRPHRLGNVYAIDSGAVFGVLGQIKPEDAPLTMLNLLCETQVLCDPSSRPVKTDAGYVRTETSEAQRPFSPYARPR